MSRYEPAVGLTPAETYQIDSDEYDSDAGASDLADEEYDRLVEEAEDGYTPEEVAEFVMQLKEQGLVNFLRAYLAPQPELGGGTPSLRKLLLGLGAIPPPHLRHPSTPDVHLLPYAKLVLLRVLRRRFKLPQYNSVEDAIALLGSARNIIVLSGAGISTSCGIPDFRSANGLYAQLQEEGEYELDDPQQMFDIRYFREYPQVFYSFAKQIYPSNFVPSPCHRWIKLLEDQDRLLRNFTQNIDTLETLAGVKKVLQCHGSFATASCLRCKNRVPGTSIEPYIMRQEVPICGTCKQARQDEVAARKDAMAKIKGKGKAKADSWEENEDDEAADDGEWGYGEPGIIKPDITFFGQALDSEFDDCLFADREKVDLLVIIGTSLKVAPVSEVLSDADTIVSYLSSKLGWTIPPPPVVPLADSASKSPPSPRAPIRTVPDVDSVTFASGVGPLAHMHQLVTTEELAARLAAQADLDADSKQLVQDVDEQSDYTERVLSSPELDRPVKRSRVTEG